MNNRAVSLVDLGRVAEAGTLWRRTLEAEPQHVEATYNAGLAAWGDRTPGGRRSSSDGWTRSARRTPACPAPTSSGGASSSWSATPAEARAAFARAAELGGTCRPGTATSRPQPLPRRRRG